MNQNVLFNDDFHWDQPQQMVCFSAQSAGALIRCFLTQSYLDKIGAAGDNEQTIVEQCLLMQFDIEDDAQQAIEDEHLNDKSELWLS